MKKAPLQQVKDRFGGKEKLVEEILGLLERGEKSSKNELKTTLRTQSNSKLLTLHKRETRMRELGGREKVAESVLQARMGKEKKEDRDYRKHIENFSTGQLLNLAKRYGIKK
jgi:hypothetical protein